MKYNKDGNVVNGSVRLGIYIDNGSISNVDFSAVESGNPGCGGTEYLYALLISFFGNKMEVHLFAPYPMIGLEHKCVYHKEESLSRAFRDFCESESGFFVLNATRFFDIASLETNGVIPVFWFHVDQEKPLLEGLNQYKSKHWNVFLTKDQMIRYSCFRSIISNAVIIPHPHPGMPAPQIETVRVSSHNVAFIGSLTPNKHLDLLTKAWPAVKRKVPDAKLYIVGAGNLYSTKEKLGFQSRCQKDYEGPVMDPLLRYRCADSVVFLGVKNGLEIEQDILPSIKVGVVNPAFVGVGETFCLSAIQFGHAGVPVIGGDLDGLRSTLPTRCGIRIKSLLHLARALIRLLRSGVTADKLGKRYRSFVLEHFAPPFVFSLWERLFAGEMKRQRVTILVALILRFKLFARKSRLYLRRKISPIKAALLSAYINRTFGGTRS